MSGADPIAVVAERITHRFAERIALDDVSFTVPRGRMLALLGPNGSGKSTLFRILATILRPTSGSASICGASIAARPDAVRRRLGVVFQRPALDPLLTVMENLRAHGHLYGLARKDLATRAEAALALMDLAGRRRDRVAALSGGLQRRVELAKALLHGPEVLLLDEPSAGLDPAARRDLMDHLERLSAGRAVTVLLTTHLAEEAERCGTVGIMHEGRLVALDAPGSLRRTIAGEVVLVQPRDPAALDPLAESIGGRYGIAPTRDGGALRFELPEAHRIVAELADAFPHDLSSVTWGRPTLDDVFLRLTGRRLGRAEGAP